MPCVRTSTTTPGQPSSATTRLLPPPTTSTGSPAASAARTSVDELVGGRRRHGAAPRARPGAAWSDRRAGRHERDATLRVPMPRQAPRPPRLPPGARGRSACRPAARRTRIACAVWTTGSPRPSAPDCVRRADPLVIDLGYGASAGHRDRAGRPAARGASGRPGARASRSTRRASLPRCRAADPPRLTFARGGFELAGQRPALVRAANVLRQYDEPAAAAAWDDDAGRPRTGRPDRRGHLRRARPAGGAGCCSTRTAR